MTILKGLRDRSSRKWKTGHYLSQNHKEEYLVMCYFIFNENLDLLDDDIYLGPGAPPVACGL